MGVMKTATLYQHVHGLHLFHCNGSNCSQKVRFYLAEKHLHWFDHHINLAKEENLTEEFLEINPNGLVPVLIHDGVTITETNDIVKYLEKHFPEPRLKPRSRIGQEAMHKWLLLSDSIQRPLKYMSFYFLFGRLAQKSDQSLHKLSQSFVDRDLYNFHLSFREGFSMELLQEKIEIIHSFFEEMEKHLLESAWLVGDTFTVADIMCVINVYRFKQMNFPMKMYTHVNDWYDMICLKQSFQIAVFGHQGFIENIALPIKTTIDRILGQDVQAVELGIKTSWMKSVIILLLFIISCMFLVDNLSIAGFSVNRVILLTILGMMSLATMMSSYHKAHTPPQLVYQSALKTMTAIINIGYGGNEMMKINLRQPQPRAVAPDDIIIAVKAASVNPIDLKTQRGYGRTLLNYLRNRSKVPAGQGIELPMIPGRDCSGIVSAIGSKVTKFKIGDEVWTALPSVQTLGTMADYVMVKETYVARKPSNISHVEAASIPYVAMTTWSALVDDGRLGPDNRKDKRVLIHGGTGGIGSLAIQLVKSWGGHVTTTCSTQGVSMVTSLGADEVVDYQNDDFEIKLAKNPKFDVIYDTQGGSVQQSSLSLLAGGGRLVTLASPLRKYTDENGLLIGAVRALVSLARIAVPQQLFHGRKFRWAFFKPNGEALETITHLVEEGAIKPVIEKTYSMANADIAFRYVGNGHRQGKTVILINN